MVRRNLIRTKRCEEGFRSAKGAPQVADDRRFPPSARPHTVRLARDARVRTVVPDRRVGTTAQSVPTGIQRIDGPLSGTISGNGSGAVDVDIAVIDTGIDLHHPDLNVVGGVNCSTGTSYDDG